SACVRRPIGAARIRLSSTRSFPISPASIMCRSIRFSSTAWRSTRRSIRATGCIRQRTGIADWVGSVGLGVCASGQEYFGVPALVVLAAALPPGGYELFGPQSSGGSGPAVLQSEWLRRVRPILGVVHGDPRDATVAATVARLAQDASLFLVGGLAAAADAPIQVAGRVVEGGLSGVLLAPDIPVVTGITQGCSPIGPTRRISEARDNIIMAIDDRPALEVFKADIGELLSR